MIGKSQKAVLDYLKTSGPSTSQQVGDALYEKTSTAFIEGYTGKQSGYWNTGKLKPEQVRLAWASKILGALKKRGLVLERGKLWSVVKTE